MIKHTGKISAQLQKGFASPQAGRWKQAEIIYRKILSATPGHSDANNLLGLLCLQTKRPKAACKHIEAALRSDPDNPQSHYNLGIACANLGQFDRASKHFKRTAELQPGNIEALSSLGNACRLAGRPDEACDILEAALKQQPGHAGVRQNLGLALNDLGAAANKQGDVEGALDHFRQALRHHPSNPQAHLNLGLSLEQSGKLKEAEECYKAAIRVREEFSDAHFYLAHLRTHQSNLRDVKMMRRLLGAETTSMEEKVRLAFGLGFAYESMNEYAMAFEYMDIAHGLQSENRRFSLRDEKKRFAAIQRVFSADRMTATGSGIEDERPVLIVGMPRSGTTLAEQVLASHGQVHAAGERTTLARAANGLAGSGQGRFPLGLENLVEGALRQHAKNYAEEVYRGAGGAARVTDTTPMNFLMAGLGAMMFPRGRIVFCVRDPLDNCLSLFRQYLTGNNHFTHRLEDLGGFYLLHRELMQHWQAVLPGRVHVLQYERLVSEPEVEVRELLDFCGLPFDENCLRSHETRRVVRSPSAAQVRQPLYKSSVGAWENYAKQLEPLAEMLSTR